MSEEERHQIIGRTIEQRSEAQRNLAALKAKALAYAQALKAAANYLGDPRGPIPGDVLERCPDPTELIALCGEIRDTHARLEQIAQLLRDMGIT